MVVTCKNTGENKEIRKKGTSPAFKLPGLGNNSPPFTESDLEENRNSACLLAGSHLIICPPPHQQSLWSLCLSFYFSCNHVFYLLSSYLMAFSYSWLWLPHGFVFLLYISQLLTNHTRKSSLLVLLFKEYLAWIRHLSYMFPWHPFLPCIKCFLEHLTSSQESP